MKKVIVHLAIVVVAALGYSTQASACHIVNADLSATCVNGDPHCSIHYVLEASTYPAGGTVTFVLTITGASSTQTVSGTFSADTGPVVGSVAVSECGTFSVTGFIQFPPWDVWNLSPVAVECPSGPGEGCTPGFWKMHLGEWAATGYNHGDDFDSTFGTELFDPDITLLQAVRALGGGVNRLARHGASALLNAAHPDVAYPLTVTEVITAVQAGDADLLEDANELGCPLGQVGLSDGAPSFSLHSWY